MGEHLNFTENLIYLFVIKLW